MRFFLILVLLCIGACRSATPEPVSMLDSVTDTPVGFVALDHIDPSIVQDIRYASADNFVGEGIDGYEAARCFLTRPAAVALARVQVDLRPFDLSLKVFDGYRPQRAVDHFVRWAEDPTATALKHQYYPVVPKDSLFAQGYIAVRSGHSRGSTVDVTLVDSETGEALDMGTSFDFFDPRSHTASPHASAQARAHRLLLKQVMEAHGFRNYAKEWWHFTLRDEPFPDTYFDFVIR